MGLKDRALRALRESHGSETFSTKMGPDETVMPSKNVGDVGGNGKEKRNSGARNQWGVWDDNPDYRGPRFGRHRHRNE